MSSNIREALEPLFEGLSSNLNDDQELAAAAKASVPGGRNDSVTFGIVSSDANDPSKECIVLSITVGVNGEVQSKLGMGGECDADFVLHARLEDWKAFFAPKDQLVRPYQSYWGMLRVLGPLHKEVRIAGDTSAFARHNRVWRIALDRMRDVVNRKESPQSTLEACLPNDEEAEDVSTVGKYTWINHSEYGKVKLFYETSGSGPQIILFLHTAGSDSRQHHSLMENPTLRQTCTMYAFDLPAHGRSSLGSRQIPESYALTEKSYLESISLVINKLSLAASNNLILCGASMAGHVCLAAAIHARALGVRGVIPCEGCAHLPFSQPIYEMKGSDSAILDPERVCGMIAPTSPEYYKRQIWWQYSSQGTNVFAGDLKFYFKGWDGRDRLGNVDTGFCPVYMLTGEYDYSCTTEASEETAAMIPGAEFEAMKGLGHFPLTENPSAVLPYLLRAIERIQKRREAASNGN
ncbi:hypothetical protein LTR70_002789 [Exophiala xenobiotica]|uniref:AB hydrolase-1 domain-containing protein n=1 Tax=Lithohypha guttulata TaxID=1690604 RepID=A0ABR0KIU9_9EURO|nr:hypothetical protein LTR24_002003 [Lithohypha guttulata]KAK5324505.1 hypothetical protein LTR70_002789 [Exophiala xenobiotica]